MTTTRPAHTILVLLLAGCVVAACPDPVAAQATDPGLPRLERELARLAPLADGTVGLAAVHVESGRSVTINTGVRFPMASVRKLPVALLLLALVDEGKERLDRVVELKATDLR